jgi:hypothetical protein
VDKAVDDARRQHLNSVEAGGDRRTVTATYRYGAVLLTLVAPSKAACDQDARRRWGEWDGGPVYSSPRSIYYDLIGETQRRTARRGMRAT